MKGGVQESAVGKSEDKVSIVLPPWTCVITGIHQRWYNGSSSSGARYDIIQRSRISETVAPQYPLVNRPKCAKTLQNDRRPFKSPHLHAPADHTPWSIVIVSNPAK